MFCPICKAEYREGFSVCADCGTELVVELESKPDESENEDKNFVELLRTSQVADIAQIKGIFDAENIRYFIRGDMMLSIRPLDSAQVMVYENDAARATELLEGIKLHYFRFNFKKNVK
jgi:hypothetical protein